MLDHAGGSEIYTDVVDGLRYWMQGCPFLYGTACPGSVPVSNGRLSIELFCGRCVNCVEQVSFPPNEKGEHDGIVDGQCDAWSVHFHVALFVRSVTLHVVEKLVIWSVDPEKRSI